MSVQIAGQVRAGSGSVLLSYGFRPFFLGGALWAAGAMVLWVCMLSGWLVLPTRFDPVSWHAHEFLFGALSAIIAGFLLTAVPSWTKRAPLKGWRLGVLALLWLAGRVVILLSAELPQSLVVIVDLAFFAVLAAFILRELVTGKNWRNLVVLALLLVFTLANALFHLDATEGRLAAQGGGLRLGLGAAIMMIAVIGGRILPAFTRNWLVSQGSALRPVPPMQRFDVVVLLVSALALVLWVIWPAGRASGLALLLMGGLHMVRLARWQGWHTGAEPLVLVLHLGYVFVPLGALALGAVILIPEMIGVDAAQHLWMAGAIGVMTLAVMTRATLGHSGRKLTAGRGTALLYGMVIISVILRFVAPLWPGLPLLEVAALFWIGAFGGYALLYASPLLRPKQGAA